MRLPENFRRGQKATAEVLAVAQPESRKLFFDFPPLLVLLSRNLDRLPGCQ